MSRCGWIYKHSGEKIFFYFHDDAFNDALYHFDVWAETSAGQVEQTFIESSTYTIRKELNIQFLSSFPTSTKITYAWSSCCQYSQNTFQYLVRIFTQCEIKTTGKKHKKVKRDTDNAQHKQINTHFECVSVGSTLRIHRTLRPQTTIWGLLCPVGKYCGSFDPSTFMFCLWLRNSFCNRYPTDYAVWSDDCNRLSYMKRVDSSRNPDGFKRFMSQISRSAQSIFLHKGLHSEWLAIYLAK